MRTRANHGIRPRTVLAVWGPQHASREWSVLGLCVCVCVVQINCNARSHSPKTHGRTIFQRFPVRRRWRQIPTLPAKVLRAVNFLPKNSNYIMCARTLHSDGTWECVFGGRCWGHIWFEERTHNSGSPIQLILVPGTHLHTMQHEIVYCVVIWTATTATTTTATSLLPFRCILI